MRSHGGVKRSVGVPGLLALLALAAVAVPSSASPGWAAAARPARAGTAAAAGAAAGYAADGQRMALRSADVPWDPRSVRTRLCDRSRTAEADPETTVELFPDVTVEVTGGQVQPGPSGAVDWSAEVAGDPDGTADLHFDALCTGSDGTSDADPGSARVAGEIATDGHDYAVASTSPGLLRVQELNPAVSEYAPGEADDPVLPDEPAARAAPAGAARAKVAPARAGALRNAASSDCHGAKEVHTIDMAVFYTKEAADKVGGDGEARAQARLGVDLVNRGFIDSRLPVRVRLVYTGPAADEPGLPEEQDDLGVYRTWASDNELWTKYSVDDIAVFQSIGTGVGSFVQNPKPSSGKRMILAMNIGYVPNLTLGHELGHNLGLDHDWVTEPDPTDYPYAHGWIAPSKKWRTIMAYPGGCAGCERINRYSDAEATYEGEPLGAPDSAAQPSDAVRMIRKNAPVVSAMQPERTPAVYCRLTVKSMPETGGSAMTEMPGPYTPGTLVQVGATANPNYRLTGWTLNGKPLDSARTDNSVSVPIDADSTLEAHYTKINCTLALHARPADGGTVAADRQAPYQCGSTVTLTATAAPGWHFVGWGSENGPRRRGAHPTTPVYRFTLDHDTVLTANFAKTHVVPPRPPAPPKPPVPHPPVPPRPPVPPKPPIPHPGPGLPDTGTHVPLVAVSLLGGLVTAVGAVLFLFSRLRRKETPVRQGR